MKFGARKIASSALWRTIEVGGNEGISFLFFIAMTRLLAPEQFGIVALAGSLLLLGHAVLQQGLPDALIQREHLSPEHLRAAFWGQFVLAGALCVLFVLLSWPIAWLLERPEFPPVMIALTPILLLQALSSTMHALLRRQLNLKASALRTVLGTLAGGLAAAGLAWAGASHWALVAQQWTVALVGFVVLCKVAPAQPWSMRRDDEALGDLLPIAKPIMISQLVSSAARRLDIFALGLFLGNLEIGIYFLITRLIYSVQLVTQHSIGEISLVVLSRLQGSSELHRTSLRQTLQVTTLACASCFGLLAILADHLVPLVFGAAWQPAETPLRVMAVFATFGAIGAVAAQILISGNAAALAARLTIGMALLQLAMILAAARFGLLAMVSAIGLAQLAVVIPALAEVGKRFELPLRRMLLDLAPILGSFILALALAAAVPSERHAWSGVALASIVFVLIMASTGAWIFRGYLSRFQRMLGGFR